MPAAVMAAAAAERSFRIILIAIFSLVLNG